MKSALFATILAIALTFVNATIKISSPIASTTWKFGTSQTVTWVTEAGDSGSKDLNLYYTKGVDPVKFQGGEPVAKVNVPDVTAGSATIDLSNVDLTKYPATSSKYFLRFGDVDGSYSSLFTITGGTCSTCTETTAPSTGSTGFNSTGTTGTGGFPSRTTITRTISTTLATKVASTSDAMTSSLSIFAIIACILIALF